MSRRNPSGSKSHGFTLVEILVVMTITALISSSMFLFFDTSLKRYFPLHEEGLAFSELSASAQRIANVLRGLTDISQADSDGITCYAYFSPQDSYVSIIKYYKSNGQLLADVTPMNANPPIGTPILAGKKTFTIISKLYTPNGVQTFVYIDANNATMSIPIANLHDVKAIQVNLGIPVTSPSSNGNDTISLQVSLRNRKTNL